MNFKLAMLNIIFGCITVISLFVTIYFGIKSDEYKKALKKMEWSDVLSAIDLLYAKLKKDKYTPNAILVPGLRGGIIAEVLVNKIGHNIPVLVGSSIVGEKNIDIAGYNFIRINDNWNIFIPNAILEFSNDKILIIDDFTLAGKFPEDFRKI